MLLTHSVWDPDSRGACETTRPERGRRAEGGPWPGWRAGWPCPLRTPAQYKRFTISNITVKVPWVQSSIFSFHLIQQGPVVAVRGQLEAGVGHGHQNIETAPGASSSRNQFTPFPHLFTWLGHWRSRMMVNMMAVSISLFLFSSVVMPMSDPVGKTWANDVTHLLDNNDFPNSKV